MRRIILFVIVLGSLQQTLTAQETKKEGKILKNTFRFNLTNPILFKGSIIFGYERVLNSRHSFSVNIGTTNFPSTGIHNTDSVQLSKSGDKTGVNFSADYRFYLAKENKFAAPRGVFIGPYYSYNQFNRDNTWMVQSTNGGSPTQVDSELKLSVHTIGFEMGYQFVFWDRLAVDMVLLGPGIGNYNLKASLGQSLSQADKEKLFDALNRALAEKFPGYSVVIDEGEFQTKGTSNTTDLGYRYMVHIGFRF